MAEGDSYSQSTSESATQGFQKKLGNFSVGSGLHIPDWAWGAGIVAVILVVAVSAYFFFFKRR